MVVAAINLRDAGGLLEEYAITCASAGEASQISRLRAGRRTAHGSKIAYASACSAGAIINAMDGLPQTDCDEAELASVLERTARIQAVKCSPHDGVRSSPNKDMRRNCPPFLMTRELTILRPSCVLTLGDTPWRAIYEMQQYADDGYTHNMSWGTLRLDGLEVRIVSLYHPAAARNLWAKGHAEMLAKLTSMGLRRADPRRSPHGCRSAGWLPIVGRRSRS